MDGRVPSPTPSLPSSILLTSKADALTFLSSLEEGSDPPTTLWIELQSSGEGFRTATKGQELSTAMMSRCIAACGELEELRISTRGWPAAKVDLRVENLGNLDRLVLHNITLVSRKTPLRLPRLRLLALSQLADYRDLGAFLSHTTMPQLSHLALELNEDEEEVDMQMRAILTGFAKVAPSVRALTLSHLNEYGSCFAPQMNAYWGEVFKHVNHLVLDYNADILQLLKGYDQPSQRIAHLRIRPPFSSTQFPTLKPLVTALSRSPPCLARLETLVIPEVWACKNVQSMFGAEGTRQKLRKMQGEREWIVQWCAARGVALEEKKAFEPERDGESLQDAVEF